MSKVTVLIAAPMSRLNVWGPVLSDDERLHVVSVALSVEDLQSKMAYNPQALVLDATLFGGPDPLQRFLQAVQAEVFLVLPPQAAEMRQAFAQMPRVREVHIGDFEDLHKLPDRIVAAAVMTTTGGWGGAEVSPQAAPSGPALVVGFRVVMFWNHAGGTGKSTLAAAVALEAATRGVPTMLVGLDTPDTNPLVLGLKPEPNITSWMANPSVEGLQESLQMLNGLAVLGGFPDVLTEARFSALPTENPASLSALVSTAARAGYALLVLDTPNANIAAQAITAATHLVLVARPSLADILSTVEAYRTVTERVSGEHRLPANHILVALNMVGGRIAPKEWHRAATEMLRDVSGATFPPLAATIPFLSAVAVAQDRRQSPLGVGEFRKAIQGLVNALVPPMPAVAAASNAAQEYRMGPVRVKVRT